MGARRAWGKTLRVPEPESEDGAWNPHPPALAHIHHRALLLNLFGFRLLLSPPQHREEQRQENQQQCEQQAGD